MGGKVSSRKHSDWGGSSSLQSGNGEKIPSSNQASYLTVMNKNSGAGAAEDEEQHSYDYEDGGEEG